MNDRILWNALTVAGMFLVGSSASQEQSNLGSPLGPVYYDVGHRAFLFDVDAYDAAGACAGGWSGFVSLKDGTQEPIYPYCGEGPGSLIAEPNPKHSLYSLNSAPMKRLAGAIASSGRGGVTREVSLPEVFAASPGNVAGDFVLVPPGPCDPVLAPDTLNLVGAACYRAPNGDVLVRGKASGGVWEGGPTWSTWAVLRSRDFLEARHWNDRAFGSYKAGNYAEAIEGFEKSKALDPKYANALVNVASVYALTGRKERALKNLRSSFRIDPALTKKRILSDRDFEPILLDPAVLEMLEEDMGAEPRVYLYNMDWDPPTVLHDRNHASFIFSQSDLGPCAQGYFSQKGGSAEAIFPVCPDGVEKEETNRANRIYPPHSRLMKRLGEVLAQPAPADPTGQSVMFQRIGAALAELPGFQRLSPSPCDTTVEIAVQHQLERLLRGACYVSADGDVLFLGRESDPQGSGMELPQSSLYFSRNFVESRHANSRSLDSYKSGHAAEAVELLEHAKKLDPRYLDAVLNLATMYAGMGRTSEALGNLSLANHLNHGDTRRRVLSRSEFRGMLSDPEVRRIVLGNSVAEPALAVSTPAPVSPGAAGQPEANTMTKSNAQGPSAAGADSAPTSMIVSADIACALSVDEDKVADLAANSPTTIHVEPGSSIVLCVSPTAPDVAVRLVQTVQEGQEIRVRVELAETVRQALAEREEAEAIRKEEAAIAVETAALRAAQELKDAGPGLLRDPRTGIVWTQSDNGVRLGWEKAKAYCQQKAMELPTVDELKVLQSHLSEHCNPTCEQRDRFHLVSNDLWTGELTKPDTARYISIFGDVHEFLISLELSTLCVRRP